MKFEGSVSIITGGGGGIGRGLADHILNHGGKKVGHQLT